MQSIATMPLKGKPWKELEGLLKEYAYMGAPQKRQDDGKVSRKNQPDFKGDAC